jgi:uncharacterized YccA/Bax inhibitor family protein
MAGSGLNLGAEQASSTSAVSRLELRYTNAYQQARAVDALGRKVKMVGIVAGAVLALIGIIAAGSAKTDAGVVGAMFAILIGVVLAPVAFVWGTLIGGAAQLMLAMFDTAINTSPFLDNSSRTSIFSAVLPGGSTGASAQFREGDWRNW